MAGILYLVPTPIGNSEDITLRSLKVLQAVDLIVCEEIKEGRKFLNQHKIEKPLETLNEHNEEKQSLEILKKLQSGDKIALISDCGTPAIADPGTMIVQSCLKRGIRVMPLPGASSLTTALSACGIPMNRFCYLGFLPPKTAERRQELSQIKKMPLPAVIMDAPYRLLPLLRDMALVLGEKREMVMAFNLTLSDEEIVAGPIEKILRHFEPKKKGEFVIIIPPFNQPRKRSIGTLNER